MFKIKSPMVMGILNITPDSFYDGGKHFNIDSALMSAEEMVSDGADIIDIGGESTRPGSEPVDTEEELRRTIPVIEKIAKKFSILISIDTYKSAVARVALDSGAGMVNDISGLRFDNGMPYLIAERNIPVVIMHMLGEPKNMQNNPCYKENIIDEIRKFFIERIGFAVKAGIDKQQIILDPGIGFGKTTGHNIEILRNLKEFNKLGCNLLLGTSRKSFLGRILGSESDPEKPEERLEASLVTYVWALQNKVSILRVHDVKATRRVVKIFQAINN